MREPDRPITLVTLRYLAKGGNAYFPGLLDQIERRPIEGLSELTALRPYLRELRERAEWKDGSRYADPRPGEPGSFTRIFSVGE